MVESYTNRSDSGGGEECLLEGRYLVTLALINVFTFVVGQPVTAKLLWISFTANKAADILNCNLALFHSFLYLVYLLNLVFLFLYRRHQSALLSVVLSYSQVGGPMSLCFICMERYVAVLHPTAYPLLRSHRWREACAALVWLCSLSVAMTTTLVSDNTSSLSGAVIKSVPFAAMVILTHLMVWATARIARALRTSSPGRDRLHPVKRKAFRTSAPPRPSTCSATSRWPPCRSSRFRTSSCSAASSRPSPSCCCLLPASSTRCSTSPPRGGAHLRLEEEQVAADRRKECWEFSQTAARRRNHVSFYPFLKS